jgi:hypothetical protein
MDGCGAARDRRDRRPSNDSLELALEGHQIGADRGKLVRGESLPDVYFFSAAHVGDGGQDALDPLPCSNLKHLEP